MDINEILNLMNFKINDNFLLMSGPCVIESEKNVMEIAERLVKLTTKLNIPYVFKASYVKANRSSIDSFTGPGAEEGLRILQKVKETFSIPIVTDVHTAAEVEEAAEVADIVQIPAFLCRQTDLLLKAGETGKIVNIKKGQFLSPLDMGNVAAKVASTGNDKIMLTERGASFGYNNLVVDFRGFMDMKSLDYPVIYDVTHSLQRPAVHGTVSGGQPEYVKQMAMAAMATGVVDGLFIETHPDPAKALSDGKSMLPLAEMEDLLLSVMRIKMALN